MNTHNSYTVTFTKVTPYSVCPAQPNLPHPALGNMTDTKRLAKLMRQCCEGIEEILHEPLKDKQAEAGLQKLQAEILEMWPWLGYSKLLGYRHDIANICVS